MRRRTGAEIAADVRQGSRRDAILYAVGANALHGLHRTNADKRNAAMTLLRDETWSAWSDREIARQCAVSDRFVNGLRAQLTANIRSDRTYTTKHGTVTTMKTDAIGRAPAPQGTPAPPQAPAAKPEPVWRQTDIEEFVPRFPPSHARPAEEIRVLIESLDKALILTPAQAAAATGGDTARFGHEERWRRPSMCRRTTSLHHAWKA
jgi:hypothetical protein